MCLVIGGPVCQHAGAWIGDCHVPLRQGLLALVAVFLAVCQTARVKYNVHLLRNSFHVAASLVSHGRYAGDSFVRKVAVFGSDPDLA
jgi:hypothetical protein